MRPIFESRTFLYERIEGLLIKFVRSTPHGMVVCTLNDRNCIDLNVSEVFEYGFDFVDAATERVSTSQRLCS